MIDNDLKMFITKNKQLFWYTPENQLDSISNELLVETILNYGDLNAVRELFILMGKETVAKIFFKIINKSHRASNNFNDITKNYFSLMFEKYA